ncbi:hypothetical protein ACS0PU_002151 [Formica fusca]
MQMRDQVEDETPAPVHSLYCLRKLIGWICIHFVGCYFRPESMGEIEITSTLTQSTRIPEMNLKMRS